MEDALSSQKQQTSRGGEGKDSRGHDSAAGPALVVPRDSAAQKRKEATQARLAAIVTSTADAVIGGTLDGIITDWNNGAERLYGYTAAEAIGQRLQMLVPPERTGEIETFLDRVRREDSIPEIETVRRTKSGRLIDVSLRISPVYDEAGRIVATSSMARDITARKAAEAERALAHQTTREVLERITDGFYALDEAWRFTYVNPMAERILGRTREALLGKTLWEEFAGADETALYATCEEAMREGIATQVEFYYFPLGTWFEARVYPSPAGVSVFFRDVTASKELESKLRASETKYRKLVQQIPVVVYVLAADAEQTPLYYSPRLTELTGESPEAALTREQPWLERVHPDDYARVAAEQARAVAREEPFRMEYRYRRTDGAYVWVRDECVPMRDPADRLVAWQGVLLNIDERIRSEEAKLQLAAIVESSNDAIIGKTLNGTITSWNPAAEKLYGYTANEVVGKSIAMLIPPGESNNGSDLLHRVAQGEHIELHETRRQTKDGHILDVALTISPVCDSAGRVIGASTIARDVTELRRLQEERDRLYAELNAEFQRAAEIQTKMLPHGAPDVPGYELAGICLPARHVGGDFFDWTSTSESVRLSLGDVMGKGLPASLLTATVRASLRAVIHLPVSDAVEAVNRALSPDLVVSDSFITLFHASLQPDSGQLTYVDAGHGMAFIQRQNGHVEPLQQHAVPLGVLADAAYPASQVTLAPGDTLVVYSDGLPDARPELGLDALGVATQCQDRISAEAKLEQLVALVHDVKTRPDDLTLVLVRRQEEPALAISSSPIPGNPSR